MQLLFREDLFAFLRRRRLRQAGEKEVIRILKARVIRSSPERLPEPVQQKSRGPAHLDDDQKEEHACEPNEAVPKRDVNRQKGGDEQRRQNAGDRSEEHTSELQSLRHLVC